MRPDELAVEAKPFAMQEQMTLKLSICPRATEASHDRLTKGEVNPLNEGRLDEETELDVMHEREGIHFGASPGMQGGDRLAQRGVDATGEDFGAGLALEPLNPVVRTIPDEGMEVVVDHTTVVAVRIGACISAYRGPFITSTAVFPLGIWTNVGFGTQLVQLHTALTMQAVMRQLGFPAAWTLLLGATQFLEPALKHTTLHEQDHQQEYHIEELGEVRHRWGSVNNPIVAPNPTTTAANVKREFSTV